MVPLEMPPALPYVVREFQTVNPYWRKIVVLIEIMAANVTTNVLNIRISQYISKTKIPIKAHPNII